jgi:hypothetical protein
MVVLSNPQEKEKSWCKIGWGFLSRIKKEMSSFSLFTRPRGLFFLDERMEWGTHGDGAIETSDIRWEGEDSSVEVPVGKFFCGNWIGCRADMGTSRYS